MTNNEENKKQTLNSESRKSWDNENFLPPIKSPNPFNPLNPIVDHK